MTAREIRKEHGNIFDDSTFSEKLGGWLCFPCRESMEYHPQGTVIIVNPTTRQANKYIIMEHEDMEFFKDIDSSDDLDDNWNLGDYEESPIQFEYVRTDGWRGYYIPEGKGWKNLHSDCILAYSKDAEELKEFDTDIKQVLWELGYTFAVCFGTTSNVFSCRYDIMIKETEEEGILKNMALYTKLMQLKLKYRDPNRFRMTALTGKDKFDDKDKLLVEASKRLEEGENFESVKEDILRRI